MSSMFCAPCRVVRPCSIVLWRRAERWEESGQRLSLHSYFLRLPNFILCYCLSRPIWVLPTAVSAYPDKRGLSDMPAPERLLLWLFRFISKTSFMTRLSRVFGIFMGYSRLWRKDR